jgi:capsular polysaccharide biosynthesis protein
MELYLYLNILRRRWRLVAALGLLVALVSLAAAATRPPRYGLVARLLVTRADVPNLDTEDTVAYDLPAIIGSAPFARDVAAEVARRGRPLSQAVVEQALHAENQRHVVSLSVTAADPGDAVAIADAAIALIKTQGLRYWGDPRATPERPGINVAVLDQPRQAALLNGPQAIALEVLLRTAVGLIAGAGLAFVLHYLEAGRAIGDGHVPAASGGMQPTTERQPEAGD